jgi:hypothetical protein
VGLFRQVLSTSETQSSPARPKVGAAFNRAASVVYGSWVAFNPSDSAAVLASFPSLSNFPHRVEMR